MFTEYTIISICTYIYLDGQSAAYSEHQWSQAVLLKYLAKHLFSFSSCFILARVAVDFEGNIISNI